MRLKTIAAIFITTLCIFAMLLGFRASYHKKALKRLQPLLASLLQNNLKQCEVTRTNAKSLKIENYLLERFEQLEIPRTQVSVRHTLEDSTIRVEAAVPRGKPTEWIIWHICSLLGTTGYHVADCFCTEDPMHCTIRLESNRQDRPVVKIVLTRANRFFSEAAKMAIVIADFGFTANQTTVDFLSFPEPLTVSMVSTKKMSAWTAQIANEYHKEIVILLPMEPLSSNYRQYKSEALFIHYTPERIRTMINNAVESIPYFAGFSNLCGAMVLEDSRVMKIILSELKKKHGYFLIDPVTHKSVAVSIARALNVPFRTIEISLDSAASCNSSISDTLQHAAMIAHKTGSVVLQARATASFINALRSQLPFLKRNGIRLVYLSELVHHLDDEKGNEKRDSDTSI